jgi:hypothetical protein
MPTHLRPSVLLLAFSLAACSGAESATPSQWTGTDGNLAVTLTLNIARDSLWGDGTYSAKAPEDLGCGGGVLAQSGPVNLRGQITSEGIGSHANFGSDWSPPYSARFVGKDTIRGQFLSADGGGCPFVLVRQH